LLNLFSLVSKIENICFKILFKETHMWDVIIISK
jgi:hypothetical protein